jgi:hypothetical protein
MAGQRYGGLVTPADLGETLAESLAGGVVSPHEPWQGRTLASLFADWSVAARDRVIVTGAEGRLPRDCERPYERQFVEVIVWVTAQAAG